MTNKQFIATCKQQIKRNLAAKDYHHAAYWCERLGDFLMQQALTANLVKES